MNKLILPFRSGGTCSPSPLPHKILRKEGPGKNAQLCRHRDVEGQRGDVVIQSKQLPSLPRVSCSQDIALPQFLTPGSLTHPRVQGWNWPPWPSLSFHSPQVGKLVAYKHLLDVLFLGIGGLP